MGWGNDGYYEKWAEKQMQKEMEQKQAEEKQMQELMEKEALKKEKMEEEKELINDFYCEVIIPYMGIDKTLEDRINEFLEERHDSDK